MACAETGKLKGYKFARQPIGCKFIDGRIKVNNGHLGNEQPAYPSWAGMRWGYYTSSGVNRKTGIGRHCRHQATQKQYEVVVIIVVGFLHEVNDHPQKGEPDHSGTVPGSQHYQQGQNGHHPKINIHTVARKGL